MGVLANNVFRDTSTVVWTLNDFFLLLFYTIQIWGVLFF